MPFLIEGALILIELIAAIQIGIRNPKIALPLEPPVQKVKVEYISKPLIAETIVTVDKPKAVVILPKSPIRNDTEVIGTSYEQCVIYAKRMTGITKSIGYAGSAKPDGFEPKVGSIALERSIGHAVVVEDILDNGIVATESNYTKGKITRRFIEFNDIRGYIY